MDILRDVGLTVCQERAWEVMIECRRGEEHDVCLRTKLEHLLESSGCDYGWANLWGGGGNKEKNYAITANFVLGIF